MNPTDMEPKVCVYRSEAIYRIRIQFQPNKLFCVSVRKPAQALQVQGDPDSPVIFNLRLGDGMINGGCYRRLGPGRAKVACRAPRDSRPLVVARPRYRPAPALRPP